MNPDDEQTIAQLFTLQALEIMLLPLCGRNLPRFEPVVTLPTQKMAVTDYPAYKPSLTGNYTHCAKTHNRPRDTASRIPASRFNF